MAVNTSKGTVRFEAFELDLRAGELRKDGAKPVRLPEQPFRILTMLLEHPGQVVRREEIRKKLWPNDTIVEFEHSISAAMNRLRQALGDSADNPRYIETLVRRGYRLLVQVEWVGVAAGFSPAQPGSVDLSLGSAAFAKGKAAEAQPSSNALSPDGTSFAISKVDGTGIQLRLLSLSGGSDREITVKGWPNITGLDWSADGKGLLLRMRLVASPRASLYGSERQCPGARAVQGRERIWGAPSPDGRYLAHGRGHR